MLRLSFRMLLFAMPAGVRARVGRDLIEALVADVRAASPLASLGRFFANATDLVTAGVAERRSAGRGGAGQPPPRRIDPVESLRALWRDAVHAVRGFAAAPGFTVVAVLSIALGIGLNAVVFSIVNALLLRPVPGAAPGRLVAIFSTLDNSARSSMSYPDFEDIAARATSFDGVMAHSLMFAGVDRGDASTITAGEIVSPNYFDVLGVGLAAGRTFAPDAARAGEAPTAIISYRMWLRDFAGRADVVGRDLTLRGRRYAIVGVAPRGFNGLTAGVGADLWVPAGVVADIEPVGAIDTVASPTGATRNEQRGQRYLFLTGRLRPGVTLAQAGAEVAQLMRALATEFPATNTDRGAVVVPASDARLVPGVDPVLGPSSAVLMIAVSLVFLVACANLTGLLLARAASRSREMAVRVAIGASRWHVIRQLIVESLMLSLAGGAAGFLIAVWVTSAIERLPVPLPVSVTLDLAPDARVFALTVGLSIVAGLLIGLLPALRTSRPNLVPALKGEPTVLAGRRLTLRSVLVATEVALSMVLLVAAGLLLRSFVAAANTDAKMDVAHAVYAGINVSKEFPDAASRARFLDEAERRVAALPGVTSVARTDRLPFALTNNTSVVLVEGVRGPLKDGGFAVDVTNVSAGYFDTLGIPIVAGRAFDSRDRGRESMPAIIVNETAARRFWPDRDPLGQQLKVRGDGAWTVVGVSADHPVRAMGETPRPFVHFAIDQLSPGFVNVVARTNGSAAALTPLMRRELVAIEPRLAFMGMEPFAAMVDVTLFPARAAMVLLGAFSALALVLAVVGLYGVVSFSVARDTRAIGIRMALGATRTQLVTGVLKGSLGIAIIGGVVGLLLAALAAQGLAGFLVGVSVFDPVSYAVALVTLLASAAAASLVPARRAATLDPVTALRS
jgi:predicted permease